MENLHARTVFFVHDAERSLTFYTQTLGFTLDWNYKENDKPFVFQVSFHGMELILNQAEDRTQSRPGHGRLFVGLDHTQAAALQTHLAKQNVATSNTHWGAPTLVVRDLDQNELFFWLPQDEKPLSPAATRLAHTKQRLEAVDADLSTSSFTNVNLSKSTFEDVNLSATRIHNVNLSNVTITDANISHMTLNGRPLLGPGLVTIPSTHTVDETVARLKAILAEKGIHLFAEIDHSGEAEKAGLPLRPTRLLIFGNPKAGTPVMQSAPTAALDLPLKILIWQSETGTSITYTDPVHLRTRHNIPEELLPVLAAVESLAKRTA